MKKLLMTACAAALVAGAAGQAKAADSATNQFTLQETVEPTCTLGSFSESAATGVSLAGNTLTITADSDADAAPDAFAVTLTAAAMCNYTTKMTLTSTNQGFTYDALQLTTTDPDFVSKLDYTAAATWSTDGSATLDTSVAASVQDASIEPTSADLVIQINSNAVDPAKRLLQGTYSDTLKVTLDAPA